MTNKTNRNKLERLKRIVFENNVFVNACHALDPPGNSN